MPPRDRSARLRAGGDTEALWADAFASFRHSSRREEGVMETAELLMSPSRRSSVVGRCARGRGSSWGPSTHACSHAGRAQVGLAPVAVFHGHAPTGWCARHVRCWL